MLTEIVCPCMLCCNPLALDALKATYSTVQIYLYIVSATAVGGNLLIK